MIRPMSFKKEKNSLPRPKPWSSKTSHTLSATPIGDKRYRSPRRNRLRLKWLVGRSVVASTMLPFRTKNGGFQVKSGSAITPNESSQLNFRPEKYLFMLHVRKADWIRYVVCGAFCSCPSSMRSKETGLGNTDDETDLPRGYFSDSRLTRRFCGSGQSINRYQGTCEI